MQQDGSSQARLDQGTKLCCDSGTGSVSLAQNKLVETSFRVILVKVHIVVRDNARNMAKAAMEFGVLSLPCMAYTLQLAVNGGALSHRSISDALAVGRRLVGHFKHSPLACSKLEDIQKKLKMPVKKLQQDMLIPQ